MDVVTTTYHDDFILASNGHTALDNEEEDTLAEVTVLNNTVPDQKAHPLLLGPCSVVVDNTHLH